MVMMVVLKAAVLLVFGISIGNAMQNLGNPLPLDMTPEAVDDMYRGCEAQMKIKVDAQYLPNEINNQNNFKQAWGEAAKYYNSVKARQPSPALTKEQVMSIHAYTLDTPKLYLDFNNAVRQQRNKYETTFAYHTLHFYLTTAIRTLNSLKPQKKKCLYSYRRTNRRFSENVLNKEIRFGTFTSSSVGSYASENFGDVSCFKIYTCFAAEISKYSKFPNENEALIPPYEVFKVTKIEKRSFLNCIKCLPCKVVYTLQSTGRYNSNLNCALIKNEKQKSFGF